MIPRSQRNAAASLTIGDVVRQRRSCGKRDVAFGHKLPGRRQISDGGVKRDATCGIEG